MVEVPDHLVPADGLCNYSVRLESMVTADGGSAVFRFEITNAGKNVAVIPILAGPESDGLDGMFARAHRDVTNVFRQLVHVSGILTAHYQKEAGKRSQPDE